MNSFQWINDLAQWLGRLLPRLTLVPPTHRGVMFGPRGGISDKGCGLTFWWPLVQKLEQVDVTVGSMDVAAVAMPMNGSEMIPRIAFLGMAVRWQASDPCLLASRSLDVKRLIDNTCQSSVGKHWDNIDQAVDAVDKALVEVREDLILFGITILSMRVSHLGVGVGLFQISDWTNTSNLQA